MLKISFKYDSVRNKTTIRMNKKSYPYRFIEYLKITDFKHLQTNRINCVFTYNGSIGEAEISLKTHLNNYGKYEGGKK